MTAEQFEKELKPTLSICYEPKTKGPIKMSFDASSFVPLEENDPILFQLAAHNSNQSNAEIGVKY